MKNDSTPKVEIKEVVTLFATAVSCSCPHCGSDEEGFVGEPFGGVFECDNCGNQYKVSEHADIEFGYPHPVAQ